MDWETGRAASIEFEQVKSREDASQAVRRMLDDLNADPNAWENATLPRFLDALAAVVEGIPNAYANAGNVEPVLDWRHLVEMLVAATGYE